MRRQSTGGATCLLSASTKKQRWLQVSTNSSPENRFGRDLSQLLCGNVQEHHPEPPAGWQTRRHIHRNRWSHDPANRGSQSCRTTCDQGTVETWSRYAGNPQSSRVLVRGASESERSISSRKLDAGRHQASQQSSRISKSSRLRGSSFHNRR